MAATLSLEPLVKALSLHADKAGTSDDVANKLQGEEAQSSTSMNQQQQENGLGARLQRLWQERGDFSKLSIEKLKAEDDTSKSSDGKDAQVQVKEVDHGSPIKKDGVEDSKDNESEDSEQTMSQEKLWELKLGILQGLDLARSDITSVLDLLQLLLNPLNALVPAVPEEALALPSGSMSSSSLHIPLPAPAEGLHTRNTALAFATKTKAIDNAGDILRRASKRLEKTTTVSQTEWTDLLRLKRSGQWKIEARAAQVPPSAGPSSLPYTPNVPFEKMAKDLCIFCGIEEASYHWRAAGLVRLGAAIASGTGISKEKGKGRGKLVVPERLEGRRRMSVRLQINGQESRYVPAYVAPNEEDTHSVLLAVQQELFEEEIFAELIREARDQPFGITATRQTLEIHQPGNFTLSVEMVDIDDLDEEQHTQMDSLGDSIPCMLLLVARLKMLQLYRRRRKSAKTSSTAKPTSSSSGSRPSSNLTESLRAFILYYQLSFKLRQILCTAVKAVQGSGIFDAADVRLDFTGLSASPERLTTYSMLENVTLGGTACLFMGSQRLNLSFGGPSSIVLHLPSRDVSLSTLPDFVTLLKRILQSAILKQLEQTLKATLKSSEARAGSSWQVLPTPKLVQKGASALAQKVVPSSTSDKDGISAAVEAFISATPLVQIVLEAGCRCEITVQAVANSRKEKVSKRQSFGAQAPGRLFSEWAEEVAKNL